jgi:hypothetical protein
MYGTVSTPSQHPYVLEVGVIINGELRRTFRHYCRIVTRRSLESEGRKSTDKRSAAIPATSHYWIPTGRIPLQST